MYSWLAALAPTVLLYATEAFAQAQPAPTQTDEPVSSLMFFTLGAVLLIAVGLFARFLSVRSNREATNRALNPDHPSNRK